MALISWRKLNLNHENNMIWIHKPIYPNLNQAGVRQNIHTYDIKGMTGANRYFSSWRFHWPLISQHHISVIDWLICIQYFYCCLAVNIR